MIKKRFDSYVLILKILIENKIKFFFILSLSTLSAICSGLSIGLIIPLLGGNDREIFNNTFFKFLDNFINIQFSEEFSQKIIEITLLIILLSILELLLSITIVRIATKYEVETVTNYLDLVFEKINKTEYKEIYEYNSGEIFTIISVDIFNFSNLIRKGLLIFQPIILLLIFITVMFSVSPSLTLISIVFFIIVSIMIAGLIGRKAKHINTRLSLDFVKNNSKLNTFLEDFKNIRSIGIEIDETEKIKKSYKELIENRRHYANLLSYSIPVNNFINIFAISFLLLSSTYIFRRQPESWTILLIPFLVLLFKLLPMISSINNYRVLVESMYPFVLRLQNFIYKNNDNEDGSENFNFEQSIKFENVNFGFGKKQVLNDVSFEINKGDVVGIVGETGAGKSTLVDLILKIFKKDSGSILIDGVEINNIKNISLHNSISFLPQNIYMADDTIEKNINLYKNSKIEKNLLGLDTFYSKNNKDDHFGFGGINLSGGQKQKINIIRTLTKDSKFLILDEPTNNLDRKSISEIADIIKNKDIDKTFLIISHDQSFINNVSSKIFYLKNGTLFKTGS